MFFAKKYHFFYAAYADKAGKPVGVTLRLNHPYINDRAIQYGRVQLELDTNAPIIAISYLGRMSLKNWNSPS